MGGYGIFFVTPRNVPSDAFTMASAYSGIQSANAVGGDIVATPLRLTSFFARRTALISIDLNLDFAPPACKAGRITVLRLTGAGREDLK